MHLEQKETDIATYSRKRTVLSTLLWIVAWPLIIGVIAIVILVVVANVLFGTGAVNSPQGYQLRALWAAYVALLVVVCAVFIWLKLRINNPLNKTSAAILRTYMWVGLALGVAITVVIPDPQIANIDGGIHVERTDTLMKPALASDPTITAVLARVGATDTDWIETKITPGYDGATAIVDQAGAYQAFVDTAGNWSYGVLTVKQGISGDDLNTVVAHEYLHHIWFKALDADTKIKLTSDLITLYGRDTSMQDRTKVYSDKQMLQPTELFSYYCTEGPDELLSPYIASECGKYINRAALQYTQ